MAEPRKLDTPQGIVGLKMCGCWVRIHGDGREECVTPCYRHAALLLPSSPRSAAGQETGK